MAISNRDRVGKALDQLRDGLLPYISTELYTNVGTNWQDQLPPQSKNLQDVTVLLNLFMDHWQGVFKKKLSQSDRAYVSELKEARNKWAHSEPISSDDADRYLDTAARRPGQPQALVLCTDAIRVEMFGDAAVQGPWPDIQQRLQQRLVDDVAAG